MERISVLVRVRPLDKQEGSKGSAWRIAGNTISLCTQPSKFDFDRVFGEDSNTLDIYEAHTKDIVAAAIRGFNGTVFAYGQTSSGKTHTMRGSPAEPGVIPLAVRDVFRSIKEVEDREFLLRMSYMEIYNEEINDLLAPEHQKLQVHESLERGIFVAGLREEIVASPEQVLQLMDFGESHRHIGETNMNVYSSRSHTIFRMVIESRYKNEDDSVGTSCDAVRVSVLNLVDLAGSERAAKTGAEGARLKEGSHINKSLMTLGTVINKLSEGVEIQGGHVPYRDSKLTRILQPALGGNAKTAIICNITPALIHVDETKGTLQFASRALRVTNCAQVNEVLTDAALLKRQKKEIEELRAKLQGSHSEHRAEEILNLRNTLLQSELERERIALELQEEKKAQAERELRLKEQAQKIENLSTMVLYSSMDDRDKRVKKNNRRETWCPNVPLKEFPQEESILPSKGTLGEIVPGRRDRDLPPPFQKLCEEQEFSSHTSSKDSGHASGQGILKENADLSSSWAECALPDARASVNVTDRKKKSPVESMTLNEVRDELLELQTRYQDLECECENQRKIKNSEIEDLKKRLAKAEAAADKQQKVNKLHLGQSTDRRAKSLTGWESEAFLMNKQLEDEVKTLELEKVYMQRDLDRLLELAKEEKENANRALEELQRELGEAQVAAVKNKEQLDSALAEIKLLKKENEESLDQILSEFDELRTEVEFLRDTSNEVQSVAGDSVQAISLAKMLLQEFIGNVVDIKLELHQMEMMERLSECTHDFKKGDRRKSAIVDILSHRVMEDIANVKELEMSTATDQLPTGSCSKSDLVPSGYDMKQDSGSSAQEPSDEEICASSITKGKLGANTTLSELQQFPLSGQLGKAHPFKCAESMSSVLSMPNMDFPCGIDILDFLKYEKQHAMKLVGNLRHLFQHEELLSNTVIHTSGLEEMFCDFQHAISESNRLVKSIRMQGCSKSCSDSEVSEVYLANSGMMSDSFPEQVNKMALIPLMDGTFSVQVDGNMDDLRRSDVEKEMNGALDVVVEGLDDEIKSLRGKIECLEAELAMAIREKSRFYETETVLLKQLQFAQAALQLSNEEKVHLEEVHAQTLIMLQATKKEMESHRHDLDNVCKSLEQCNSEKKEANKKNDLEKEMNCALDVVVEGLDDEIKNLRGKIECLQAELAMEIQEKSRSYEAETVLLKQLQFAQAALQLLNEEKVHLEEVHAQTLIKLQATEKEMKSHRHDLDNACKSFEQCNSDKKEANKRNDVVKEVNGALNVVEEGLDDEIKSLRGKADCLEAELAMAIQEKSRCYEAETVLFKQLQFAQSALQLSNEEKLHLEEVHAQTLIKLQATQKEMESHGHDLDTACKSLEQCNFEKKEANEKSDVGKEVNGALDVVVDGLQDEIKSLRGKAECFEAELAMAIHEKSRFCEAETVLLKQLQVAQAALQLSNEEKVHLEEVHAQTLIKLRATEKEMESHGLDLDTVCKNIAQCNSEKKEANEKSDVGKEVNGALDVVVEGLEDEIKSLRGKVECLEAELAMGIHEKGKFCEAETVLLKQLQFAQAALQLSIEEKVHLEEVHAQTLIKLQATEKEVESHRHDLDIACKSLEQCNSEKKEADEKICQLELFLCQKVEEQNLSAKQHKSKCEGFLKMTDELEKKIEEQNASVNKHKSTCEAFLKMTDDLNKDVHASLSQKIEEHKMLITNHENTCAALRKRIHDLETEKAAMTDQIGDGNRKLEELKIALDSAKTMQEEQGIIYIAEKTQLTTEVSSLRKEVAKSASSAVTKERESLRKELEKTKLRLKDTEAKLRNILQEKSKLEAEKANTDREIKLLRGQSTLLQRDISKRESLADKRRESRAFDLSKTKNQFGFLEQSLQLKTMELERANFDLEILQESCKNAERTLSEVQDMLAASEGKLCVACEEKETLASKVEVVSEKLKVTSSELDSLHEKHALLNQQFQERENICRHLEDSLSAALKEKEEIALQITDAFLQLEEEKAVSSSQEKASMKAFKEEERRKLSMVNAEVSVLKEDIQKLKMELESSKDQCKHLSEQLSLAAVNSEEERRASSLELDELREKLHRSVAEHGISENAMRSINEDLKSRAEVFSLKNEKLSGEVAALRNELERVTREGDGMCKRFTELSLKLEEVGAEKLTSLSEQAILKERYSETQCKLISATNSVQSLTERTGILTEKLTNEQRNFIKETTKLEIRLKTTRAKLDAYRGRFEELADEHTVMHRKFKEDSRKLKEQLVAARLESFELKKEAYGRGVSYIGRNMDHDS